MAAVVVSDDLVISGGGSTRVAVDELFADVGRLDTAEGLVRYASDRFGVARSKLDAVEHRATASGPLPWPGDDLRFGWFAFEVALGRLRLLRFRLVMAAELYGATERTVGALWDLGGAVGASVLGFLAPRAMAGAAVSLLPVALPAAAALGLARMAGSDPGPAVDAAVRRWLGEHRGVLNDPAFVRFVRTFADHADDFVLGALNVPAAPLVGSATEAPESASLILGVTGLLSAIGIGTGRTLVDGPVRVERVTSGPARDPAVAPSPSNAAVPPPRGFEDLADRVPRGDAQITVERHHVDGENRWLVYIAGTADFGLVAGSETNDMTSNVHGIADDSPLDALRLAGSTSAGAERGVRLALAEAGALPGDPIVAVGHSGGGVIAASLAADPGLNVVGGLNLGGPVASAQIPETCSFISVEHADDLVPATGGSGHPSCVVVVSRRVNEHGSDGDAVLPAHQFVEYGQTTALLDESDAPQLVAFREQLQEFTAGTVGEQTRWRAERVPDEEP
ncbi:hypothetical protein [Agromyces sp. PvR057]|uniref:hypothetical protein n=1 Tax=Agromyces sp. PvR057 TaxID=3156403 RepID=UPI000E231ABA